MDRKNFTYPGHMELVKPLAVFIAAFIILMVILAVIIQIFPPVVGYIENILSPLVGYPIKVHFMEICTGPMSDCMSSISFFFISCLIALIVAYAYPDIEVNEDGIRVEFLWMHLPVKWSEIVDIQTIIRFPFKLWRIRVKKLTVFHHFYSLSIHPGFIITEDMEDHKELLQDLVKRRAHLT